MSERLFQHTIELLIFGWIDNGLTVRCFTWLKCMLPPLGKVQPTDQFQIFLTLNINRFFQNTLGMLMTSLDGRTPISMDVA